MEGFLVTRALIPRDDHLRRSGLRDLLRTDALITAAILLPLPLNFVAAHLATPRAAAAGRVALEASGRVTGAITRIFGAVQAVKVANAEAHVVAYLHRLNDARHRAGVRDRALEQTTGAAFASTTSLGTELVLLLAGGGLPTRGEITVRRLAAVGGAALGAARSAGRAGASPSRRARGPVTRYTPPSTAKRGLPSAVRPRLLEGYW